MSEEQPVEGQELAPAVPVAAPQPTNPGPWDADLAQFTDAATRAQVDQLLRTRVQPYTTQLEQKAAAAADAQRLYDDLTNNPAETMAALANDLQWSPEVYEAPPVEQQQFEQPEMDPRLAQLLAEDEQRKAEASYDSEMNRAVEQHPGLRPELFHPFVGAADGDFDQAYTMYENWINLSNQVNAPEPDLTPAPPTLGSDQGGTTPPVAPKALTIGETVAKFMADNAPNNDPPPIS